jgi:class 3 adenylate cyclase/tetratricopeptide (TPR) repeat protein
MNYDALLEQVLEFLQREKRLSYRVLKLRLQLDDDTLEALKEDLIYAKQLAVDEEGKVLVWAGDAGAGETSAAATREPARPSRSYTPPHLAEKILTSRGALEGERKQVTVLFADLKGSMELLAERDPEEARQLLDPVLERMMAAVHHYEGTVNQIMGDGIMALFGAPIAHEDHAVRACYAALAMQAELRRYSDEVRRTHGLPVDFRVGLNSGEVVVRAIDNDLHMDYSAIGQTVHLAARMEQLAMPGAILITPEVLRLAEGYVLVKSLGPVPIKGWRGPLEVYEVMGAGPVRTRLQAAATRGLTRFVGRHTELVALRQASEKVHMGHGQVAAVIGEAGVGKSRLFWEFPQSLRTDCWLVLESRSVSYGKATPFLPVIELLKTYFQLDGRDDARQIRERVTVHLQTLDEALEPMLPAFLALLDVPVGDPQWQTLDPPQRRQAILNAVKCLLLRESQVQPVLWLFEDLHWIDTETQALLDNVVESLPAARLLLLANYRPEYHHGWGNKTYYTQLRLDPLPSEHAEELLQALVGDEPGLQPLTRMLIERTKGNPFFLEESVRTLVETQVLVEAQGAFRLAQPLPSIQVPATVHAVLAARMDRLPPEEKRLLQMAAVIGTEVPLALLQSVAELPEEALRVGLAHLQAAEFLYETRLFPTLEYTFKHALTHEVAYGSLLLERRRVLHARIVEALEALNPDRLADHVERIAHHALQGEVWDKALVYCRQAGEKAMARSAHHQAVGSFEQALGALPHLPQQHHTREQAIDLRLALASALRPLGDFKRILALLREAKALAEALDDPHRLGQISARLSVHFRLIGAYDQAIAAAERALAHAVAGRDIGLQALANQYLGLAYVRQGNYRRALACYRQTVAFFDGTQGRERFGNAIPSAVRSRVSLATCHAQLGMFAEGRAVGEEGLGIAEAMAHPASLMYASWGLGLLSLCQGDLQGALPRLERAMGLCQDADLPIYFHQIAAPLGAAYALAGRVADAVQLLTEAIERATAMEMVGFQVNCHLSLGEAHLLAGRLEEAQALAERARALACEHQGRGEQAYALRILGDIAAHCDPPESALAEAHYRDALALAVELGMRPLVAHCHLGLGRLYGQMGRVEPARAELSAAIELYRAMAMTFWLPQVEATLAQVEGR